MESILSEVLRVLERAFRKEAVEQMEFFVWTIAKIIQSIWFTLSFGEARQNLPKEFQNEKLQFW